MKILKRISLALALALLTGLVAYTPSAADDGPNPNVVVVMQSFRSQARYDGNVIEYADDYWTGGSFNSTSTTINIGDDNTRKNWIGILDFDTAQLPDNAAIIGAFVELHVLKYNTRFGDPYMLLGDINAEFTSPYYGSSRNLESQDFNWMWWTTYAGMVSQATAANQKIELHVDAATVWQISVTQPTQFMLYFFDDNDDAYPQGITIASGNHSVVSFRPLLTVYFYYP